MHEFIAALRQLRFPIVLIAAAILILQALVSGLSTAHAAARIASGGADILCHGNGDNGSAPAGQAAHDCCTFCTAAGPAALTPATAVLFGRLVIIRHAEALAPFHAHRRLPRAIRAGPSQAPPTAS